MTGKKLLELKRLWGAEYLGELVKLAQRMRRKK